MGFSQSARSTLWTGPSRPSSRCRLGRVPCGPISSSPRVGAWSRFPRVLLLRSHLWLLCSHGPEAEVGGEETGMAGKGACLGLVRQGS